MKRPAGSIALRVLLSIPPLFSALILAFFMVRRWIFLLAALPADKPQRPSVPPASQPRDVLLFVPFHNEAAVLPDLLRRLERLDYPAAALTIVLVDDGSTDGGRRIAGRWTAQDRQRHVYTLPDRVGKASALNAALAAFPGGELVAVYDADERPCPDALSRLVRSFTAEDLGAVSGRRAVSNPLASPIASYTAFEALVHQLVTMRAKQRLKLAPAILGSNCVYRRQALAETGGFLPGALLEDSHISLKLARASWRTSFHPQAVSHHAVPATIRGYWRQHTRWASGFQDVARRQARPTFTDSSLPWPLRLELLAFSAGYLDRIAWLIAVAWLLAEALIAHRLSPLLSRVLSFSLMTPLLQVIVALGHGRAPAALWGRIMLLPLFLLLDIVTAAAGMLQRSAHWALRSE